MSENISPLLQDVADYYSRKLGQYGETAQGVDWNGTESQILRFEQLCKIIAGAGKFSINDLGCGYGALLDYLSETYRDFSYYGTDVSEHMVAAATKRYGETGSARFSRGDVPENNADYGVASGVLNVRMGRSDEEWQQYVENVLDILNRTSRRGFAFNCLTSYSDVGKMRSDLYYADPLVLFDLCKTRYSRNVALLHDYKLFEFTILVRKE